MTPELAQAICHFPERLHPVSQLFFERFVQGFMTTADFLRFFFSCCAEFLCLTFTLGLHPVKDVLRRCLRIISAAQPDINDLDTKR